MNSRERVLAALEHGRTDRVPIAQMWIDLRIVQAIVPGGRDSNDLVEHLDLDMVTVATMIYGRKNVLFKEAQGKYNAGDTQRGTGYFIVVK